MVASLNSLNLSCSWRAHWWSRRLIQNWPRVRPMHMAVWRSRHCSQIWRILPATNSPKVGSIRGARMPARPSLDWTKLRLHSLTSKLLIKLKVAAMCNREGSPLTSEMTSTFNLSGRWSHPWARSSIRSSRHFKRTCTDLVANFKKLKWTNREMATWPRWQQHWRTFSGSMMTSRIKAVSSRKVPRSRW